MPNRHFAQTQYPILSCLSQRWSPRAFDPARTVSDAVLHRLFEAARWSASSYNEQPWRFFLARREADAANYEKAIACLIEPNQAWARQAPVLVLTAVSTRFTHNNTPNRCAVHDLGLAVGNLSAQATHEGLCVHQMGGVLLEKMRETYGIPAGFDPFTAIAIGHPTSPAAVPENMRQMETAPRQRKALDDIVFGGQWESKSGIF